jgi:hypothetical protein
MRLSSGWNDESMRIVVLSDTHAPRFWKRCPSGVAEHLFAAEVILHAGDVCVASVLEELSAYAPVHAVLGNNDGPDVSASGASETAELDLAGLRVGMIHDAGPREGRLARLRAGSPGSTSSSSVTPISRCRQSTVISGSSTPAHPRQTAPASSDPRCPRDRVLSPHPRRDCHPALTEGDERSAWDASTPADAR